MTKTSLLSEKNEPLDHDLMATIWEKAISILVGNLNSGRDYYSVAKVLKIKNSC